jgi:hypothetical protein
MKNYSKINKALELMDIYPDVPIAEIARKVGCSRQNMSANYKIKLKKKGENMNGFENLVGAVKCAKELKVKYQWLIEAADAGVVPAVKYGKQWRFNPNAVKSAIEAIAAGTN